MTIHTKIKSADDSVNVDALLGAREALEGAPSAANFTWRTECKWISGTHILNLVSTFIRGREKILMPADMNDDQLRDIGLARFDVVKFTYQPAKTLGW